jgi:hypothetical protein
MERSSYGHCRWNAYGLSTHGIKGQRLDARSRYFEWQKFTEIKGETGGFPQTSGGETQPLVVP